MSMCRQCGNQLASAKAAYLWRRECIVSLETGCTCLIRSWAMKTPQTWPFIYGGWLFSFAQLGGSEKGVVLCVGILRSRFFTLSAPMRRSLLALLLLNE